MCTTLCGRFVNNLGKVQNSYKTYWTLCMDGAEKWKLLINVSKI